MNKSIVTKISKHEKAGYKLKKQKKMYNAMEKFEEALRLRFQIQHEGSPEILKLQKEISIICNILSMGHLQQENFSTCAELLKKAESIALFDERMCAVTYNNFACLYRRTKKFRSALSYLEKALEIEYGCLNRTEEDISDSLIVSTPADIHLNICAILSQMEKHDLALQHAMKALILLQDELVGRLTGEETKEEKLKKGNERITVLCIAYHNIAVEQEFLKQYNPCLRSYRKAAFYAREYIGPDASITANLENVYEQVTKKIAGEIEKVWQRKNKSKHTMGT